jgi:hypothetical protein
VLVNLDNLGWETPSRLVKQTARFVFEGVSRDNRHCRGNDHPECGQYHLVGWGPDRTKAKEEGSPWGVSLSLSLRHPPLLSPFCLPWGEQLYSTMMIFCLTMAQKQWGRLGFYWSLWSWFFQVFRLNDIKLTWPLNSEYIFSFADIWLKTLPCLYRQGVSTITKYLIKMKPQQAWFSGLVKHKHLIDQLHLELKWGRKGVSNFLYTNKKMRSRRVR